MAETRKVAAILVSDVVGYSRLAGVDEDRTLARLRSLRSELIEPTVTAHNGRIVKSTGDGSLVEFRSVVDAVRCAVAVQKAMVERNVGVARDRRIVFRIGIHLGEIVEESDGDLMGNGVNIAARLEGVAKPGGICLSEDAYRQVRTRLDVAVTELGETHLKNIAQPIRAYSLEIGKPARAARTSRAWDLWRFAPWLGASLTLGVGLATLFVASPQPLAPIASPTPVASLMAAPVDSSAAAPVAAATPNPPLPQAPIERVYPTTPVREPHKTAGTAPSARPDRPSSAANEAIAAVADAPSPPYSWPSPLDIEQAQKTGWAAPPTRPDHPTSARPATANEALAAVADAPSSSYSYTTPVYREQAHKGGWVAQSVRPDHLSSTPGAVTNQAFASVADVPSLYSWTASPTDYGQAHKGGWVPQSARPDHPSSKPAVVASQTFAAAAVAETPAQSSWPTSPSDYEQAHKGGWVAPQ